MMLPPEKFETIKQPAGSRICGACVAAMATGKDLLSAQLSMRPVHHKDDGKIFYTSTELFTYLARYGVCAGLQFGVPAGETRIRVYKNSSSLIPLNINGHPALVGVPSETFAGSGHWVFWDGEFIRDPSSKKPEKGLVEDYVIETWIPLTYIDNSEELACIATSNVL